MKPQTLCVAFCVLLLSASVLPAAEPLWIQLGEKNQGHGLSVPSGGDGTNVADVAGGSPCRRIKGEKSHYLYIKADAALVPPGDYDAYAIVEYFDDVALIGRVEYDVAPVVKEKNTFYTASEDMILLIDSGKWRRAVIHLPHARFGHGQNGGADLRLCGQEMAVRRIEILFSQPKDYRTGGFDVAALEKLRTRIGEGMELDLGCDATEAEANLYKMLGFNSVESYVTWQTVEDAGEGQWDWSKWDRQVEVLRKAGLKWAPLLVCGPAYSLPKWFRESSHSVPYICLEHGEKSKIQSLWDPKMRYWVERFVKTFADRYRDTGMLQLVRLGVTGIYGETLYPSGPSSGWIFRIPGAFHNHHGWWAADPLAVKSFRETMVKRYGDIAALNRAWATKHVSFADVMPMLPDKAPSLRARVDFVNWYLDCMTEYAGFWSAVTRKHFPNTPIYQSLGGAGEPVLGADFSAQAKAAAPYHVRVRVTNEGSDYASNFAVTREVVSAARAFGLEYGMEPASSVSSTGNVARIYNATASGAIHLFCYKPNIIQNQESVAKFRRYAPWLQRREPEIRAGLFLPKTSWEIDDGSIHRVLQAAKLLRDRMDFEMLDRTTMRTLMAERMKVIAVPEAPYAELSEIETLQRWVEAGGILVAREANGQLLRTPDGSDAARDALLARPPASHRLVRPVVRGQAPKRFVLTMGLNRDEDYLFGDWYGLERGSMVSKLPGARMRWTSARAGCYLPCDPSADATLTLTANLLPQSLKGVNRVLVNGTPVGTLDKAGSQAWRFDVPKQVLAGRTVAELSLEIQSFMPTQKVDTRKLGLAVNAIEICSKGAEKEPASVVPLALEVDWQKVDPCVRRIGRGATLVFPGESLREFNAIVAEVAMHPERVVLGAKRIELNSPEVDGVFATELKEGVLYYNSNNTARTVNGVKVPAHGIAGK